MPNLLQRQQRIAEVGRIRIGEKRIARSGKEYPAARDTFRFTSKYRHILEAVAEKFGGTVQPWSGHVGEFELLTDLSEIRVLFSAKERGDGDLESLVQHWERWAGNTCTHRCDGQSCRTWERCGGTDEKPEYQPAYKPCTCDHEDEGFRSLQKAGKACTLVSRLLVLLPEIPTLGLWRVETKSRVFDQEIQGLVDLIAQLGTGLTPLKMSITFRQKRTGPGAATERFPVLSMTLDDEPVSLAAMVEGLRAKALGAPVASLGDAPLALPESSEGEPIVAGGTDADGTAGASPAPLDAEVMEGEVVDDTDAYLATVLGREGTHEFKAWCDGEGLDASVIVGFAKNRNIRDSVSFWEGAEKYRQRTQGGEA